MIIARHDRQEIRNKNRETLANADAARQEIIARLQAQFEGRYEEIVEQIRLCQDERSKYLENPVTKKEFLEIAKERLAAIRKDSINYLLSKHLEDCQQRNSPPFSDSALRVHILPHDKAWRLFGLAVDDSILKEAIDSLPDIGMPAKERDARIKELDERIEELENTLKEELEKAKNL